MRAGRRARMLRTGTTAGPDHANLRARSCVERPTAKVPAAAMASSRRRNLMDEKKPLMCRLRRHRYRVHYNQEGQDYFLCERCEKYRDSFHMSDSSTGF